jgi:hypothetical protein
MEDVEMRNALDKDDVEALRKRMEKGKVAVGAGMYTPTVFAVRAKAFRCLEYLAQERVEELNLPCGLTLHGMSSTSTSTSTSSRGRWKGDH